ncbi:MAG: hypothetical protein ACRDS0_08990 [Pseudonocardiaceae bacterium]
MNMNRIEGKVAQILNSRELVINRGVEHGVEIGMQFAVLNNKGGDIKDPDTGGSLGSVELPKVLLKVVRVYGKMSVASTFRQFRTTGGTLGSLAGITEAFYAKPETRTETLRTNERTYREELDEEDSYVHTGDLAVEVKGDEFAGWTARR